MCRMVLVLMVLSTALPAAAQTTVGVRAGLGSARMAVPGGVDFTPCPPALSQVRNRRRSGAHLRSRLRHPGLQVRRCLRSSDWHRLHPKGGCSVRIRRQRRARQRETLDELPSVLDAPTLPDIRFAVVGLSLSALGLRTSCRARRATWQRSSVRGATPESPWARGCRLRCPPFPMRVSEWKGSTTGASKGPRNRAHPPWVRRG